MNSAARNAMRSGLRGCQKTIKYSSATEPRGKSERGNKPLSRSIKQFSELFKFRKLDGQRGEKVFFSPLPARNAMRSGLLLLKGPLCQEGAVAAGDWGRNPRRSVCRGGRPCPPLRTQAKCHNKLAALIPSVCAKRRLRGLRLREAQTAPLDAIKGSLCPSQTQPRRAAWATRRGCVLQGLFGPSFVRRLNRPYSSTAAATCLRSAR